MRVQSHLGRQSECIWLVPVILGFALQWPSELVACLQLEPLNHSKARPTELAAWLWHARLGSGL